MMKQIVLLQWVIVNIWEEPFHSSPFHTSRVGSAFSQPEEKDHIELLGGSLVVLGGLEGSLVAVLSTFVTADQQKAGTELD